VGVLGRGALRRRSRGRAYAAPMSPQVAKAFLQPMAGVSGEAAEDLADVNPRLVGTYGSGAGFGGVAFGDECEGGWDVESFADSHERADEEQFVEGGGVAGPPGDDAPDEEAAGDDVSFAEAVGDPAAEGGEQGIRPFEEGEDESPVRLVGDGGNVRCDGALHGAEHLAIEVV
jgi:hypothetical protein